MAPKRLTVFIYPPHETKAVPAGIFSHDAETGIGTFSYGRKYLERSNALAVDPVALPMGPPSKEVTTNSGMYGAFRDASPDYWGRLVIATDTKVAPESLSEVDFLLATNATRVGNLDFRHSPEDPEPTLQPPHFDQLADILFAAEKIAMGEQTEQHFLQLLRQGTSMGGAQPKCTVEWDDALWIAKFPAKGDTINIPRIEFATLLLAERCGIRTPEVRVVTVAGREIFLCRRFDREKSADGWLRRGFISALSLRQWDERDRWRWDYPAMADTMRRYSAAADIKELYQRMLFNILVRNTDDHPRNHGFLAAEKTLHLSPAYDIVPSLTRPGVGADFRLAMSIGHFGREATLQNALSRNERFGLTEDEARNLIEQMTKTVQNWKEFFHEQGVSERDIDVLSPSMQAAFLS
jgi:serine/threonine-protein kinase HipA